MSEQFKRVLVFIGIPLALMLLCLTIPDGAIGVGVLALLFPFIYLIAGIVMLFTTWKKQGQALLIAAGVIFLVGFSVCTAMLNNMNFH